MMFNNKAEKVLIHAASRYKYEAMVFTLKDEDENAYFQSKRLPFSGGYTNIWRATCVA